MAQINLSDDARATILEALNWAGTDVEEMMRDESSSHPKDIEDDAHSLAAFDAAAEEMGFILDHSMENGGWRYREPDPTPTIINENQDGTRGWY